jgi:hypothetical protein
VLFYLKSSIWAGVVAQVVEHLPRNCKALSLTLDTSKKEKERNGGRKEEKERKKKKKQSIMFKF